MKVLILIFCIFTIIFTSIPVYADCKPGPNGVNIADCFGFSGKSNEKDYNSLGGITSILVMPAFSIAAAVVILYFLSGAFKYMTSNTKEGVEEARQTIFHAIFGFFILMMAFFIIQFVLHSLFGIKGSGFGIIGI